MKFYSTNKKSPETDLKSAVLQGLAPDNGLYMPEEIRKCSKDFIENISSYTFAEVAFNVAYTLLEGSIDKDVLKGIVNGAINFDAPNIKLKDDLYALELFHGPSLAFKDFGARFMARLMAHFVKDNEETLHILVATSGDTGGAVALGFLDVPGIEVSILYPSGKVSDYQEKQLTTLGHNIYAYELDGVFDDCQAIVKEAFLDSDLRKKKNITSANSISISRLIPQIFYYFWSYAQLENKSKPVAMSVPSGNFGNLTAGLIAKCMGLPIDKFVASLNRNDGFKKYLHTGSFTAMPSIFTISNAMDVGNPSNLARIIDMYKTSEALNEDVLSYSFSDEETLEAVKKIKAEYDYVSDPHGAVAYLGLKEFLKENKEYQGIFQITAHPSKFIDTVEKAINEKVEVPERLSSLAQRKKESILISSRYEDFRESFLSR